MFWAQILVETLAHCWAACLSPREIPISTLAGESVLWKVWYSYSRKLRLFTFKRPLIRFNFWVLRNDRATTSKLGWRFVHPEAFQHMQKHIIREICINCKVFLINNMKHLELVWKSIVLIKKDFVLNRSEILIGHVRNSSVCYNYILWIMISTIIRLI